MTTQPVRPKVKPIAAKYAIVDFIIAAFGTDLRPSSGCCNIEKTEPFINQRDGYAEDCVPIEKENYELILAPHSGQNLVPGESSVEHLGQRIATASLAPHSGQNFAP